MVKTPIYSNSFNIKVRKYIPKMNYCRGIFWILYIILARIITFHSPDGAVSQYLNDWLNPIFADPIEGGRDRIRDTLICYECL